MKKLFFAIIVMVSSNVESQVELIQNGSFEQGEQGWDFSQSVDAYGDLGSCSASEGVNYLWFGDFDELTGLDNLADEVSQSIQLPANLSYAEFSFYWSGGSDEQDDVDDWDFLYFGLVDANGDEINYDAISNADMDITVTAADCDPLWYLEGFTIPAQYAGHNITVFFYAETDDINPTLFRVDEVSVLAFTTNGIEEENIHVLRVSPNPVENQLTIEQSGDNELPLIITDVNGKVMLNQLTNSLITKIDVSNFQSGIYFIKSSSGVQQKFIKK
jgi:hypothetical protein